ncbi:MAG: XdhC family protein [Actinobacteria bacterium]|nr:XdhC family protein [Actinomycetota bacterium]
MAKDLLELAHEFSHSGEAFALATVVWRRAPSSGKVGYKALVTAKGEVSGWVAGACTEPLVVRQAKKALKDGEPRLMLIGAEEDLQTRARDGLLTFPTTCQSEGALEIYVEPHLPTPQVVIVGRSPVVDTLASLANELGWRTVIVDDEGGSLSDHSSADEVRRTLDLTKAGVNSSSYVMVATLGHYDEEALEAALATEAAYIGLVASRKRADAVMEYLRDNGAPQDAIDRIKAPAGLDLGRIQHEEMAVAVLAEIVQRKAAQAAAPAKAPKPTINVAPDDQKQAALSGGSNGSSQRSGEPAETEAAEEEEAVDPVCDMIVTVAGARYHAEHKGKTYYFCCPACRKLFQNSPEEYLKPKQDAKS